MTLINLILPRDAGEGDREAVEGATADSMSAGLARILSSSARGRVAPSTTLRAVPLPRSASLLGGGSI
jgi:hypothetical protein